MVPTMATLNLARRLLNDEAAGATTNLAPAGPPVLRVYEKLRRGLYTLAGVAGFRSLVSRALTLAGPETPGLSGVHVTADGILEGLREFNPQALAHQADEEEVILIAQLLGLILVFVGEAVLLQLITPEIAPCPMLSLLAKPCFHPNYDAILDEVGQLQGVSERLEELAEQHPAVTEALLTMAGSVRDTATLLSVLVVVKSPGSPRNPMSN